MTEVVLQASNLSKSFNEGDISVDILHDVSFSVNAGESVAVLGASGSGKSTLLHLLAGLEQPTAGEVRLLGQVLGQQADHRIAAMRNKHMGFVYQFHHLMPEFSALENVSMPLLIGGVAVAEAKQRAADCLAEVGLSHRESHRPGEMSGGERQRTAIARALVNHPKCVLADEPTGNLDSTNANKALNAMLALQEKVGAAVVVVTHDQTIANRLQRTVYLADGRIQ